MSGTNGELTIATDTVDLMVSGVGKHSVGVAIDINGMVGADIDILAKKPSHTNYFALASGISATSITSYDVVGGMDIRVILNALTSGGPAKVVIDAS